MKKCCFLVVYHQVYSPNLYNYSTYVSGYAPLRHYTPISSYSYHLPSYSYDYSLPGGSLYLPSAVPMRYYSRSSPVRVVTSPLTDYVSPRIYSINVRPSVIHREMMRIEHKTRPRYGYDPTEDYLNSASSKVGSLFIHDSLFTCLISPFHLYLKSRYKIDLIFIFPTKNNEIIGIRRRYQINSDPNIKGVVTHSRSIATC